MQNTSDRFFSCCQLNYSPKRPENPSFKPVVTSQAFVYKINFVIVNVEKTSDFVETIIYIYMLNSPITMLKNNINTYSIRLFKQKPV